ARARLFVCSALFGLVGAEDRIPAYRLSGGSKLPGVGNIRAAWQPSLGPVLSAMDGPIVDLRSGAYTALAPLPSAITVRVVTAEGKIVSHHNKSTKGRIARILACTPARTTSELVEVTRAAGLAATQTGPTTAEVVG
nr:peroxide stress protein YaaA [Longispora sp. (in: high G+C Gram-positive bacteria)]